MHAALTGLLWLAALALTLVAGHYLVHALSLLGARFRISDPLLGLIVALGADAPEVISALLALSRGANDIGIGVIVGSNIYNLAGLLGLAAVVAGQVPPGPARLSLDRAVNVFLTVGLGALILVPLFHVPIGAVLVLAFTAYALAEAMMPERATAVTPEDSDEPRTPNRSSTRSLITLVVIGAAGIIAGSDLLVSASISLGPDLGIPESVIATFALPIATSLPNTWAAVLLARRGMAVAAIATTFNSNSINAALGAGLPSIVLVLHASHAARVLDLPWLALMTLTALILVGMRRALGRVEGCVLIGMYGLFVVLRLLWFG
ncbi:MAG: sodium:calcium antiporter [Chloroflexota bacterium]|nr:MAG: hypothetical protein DLM70_15270 [Chloroflexota bacterium]